MSTTMWAAVLAPIVGGLFWWAIQQPAKWVHDYLWKRMPEGRFRDFLFKQRST